MLISKDWLDHPSALANRAELMRKGYLPAIPFNRVLDMALEKVGLTRSGIYISPVFQLLTPKRSSAIPIADCRASFEAVVKYEIMGRTPVALGLDSARVLAHFGIEHVVAPHPSARIGSYAVRAKAIAEAIEKT